MQIPKLKVLVEAGAVRAAEVTYAPAEAGWTVQITYASRHGERCEGLDRQRGGTRVFATLDAVARAVAGPGLRTLAPDGFAAPAADPPPR